MTLQSRSGFFGALCVFRLNSKESKKHTQHKTQESLRDLLRSNWHNSQGYSNKTARIIIDCRTQNLVY